MSVLQTSLAVIRRTRAPEDVIDDLETKIEILEAIVRDLSGADLVEDLRGLYPRLPPMAVRLLAILMRREMASRTAITAALYGLRDEPTEPHTIIVHLSRLRRGLPRGSIRNHWNMGWSLDPHVKADIRAAIAGLKATASQQEAIP